jgi:hypothetical protein
MKLSAWECALYERSFRLYSRFRSAIARDFWATHAFTMRPQLWDTHRIVKKTSIIGRSHLHRFPKDREKESK